MAKKLKEVFFIEVYNKSGNFVGRSERFNEMPSEAKIEEILNHYNANGFGEVDAKIDKRYSL